MASGASSTRSTTSARCASPPRARPRLHEGHRKQPAGEGEGDAKAAGDAAAAAAWAERKEVANGRLQECSAKYNAEMKALRERGWD